MASIELGDVRIHYQWDGPEERPVLLLSNGLGTNLSMWEAQVPIFSKHFRVLRYDSRGHGKSSAPPPPYSIEQMGRDVLELLDALGIDSCSLCGLSMGGTTGQWLGVNARNRIRKLVLCNTAAKIGTTESWNDRIETVREKGVAAVIPIVLARWFTPDFQESAPEILERTRTMFVATDPEGYVGGCAAIRDTDLRESVRHISAPTLVVAGTYDMVTPPALGKSLVESIAGARYLELSAAHLSNIEAAAEFTKAVTDFLVAS